MIATYLLGDDPNENLRSCSCLSHSWRRLVLPHLFATVKPVEVDQLDDFAIFVKSNPDISIWIRNLRIFGDDSGPSNKRGGALKTISLDYGSSFVRILLRLRSLEYLRCSSVCLSPPELSKPSRPFQLRRFVWDQCHVDATKESDDGTSSSTIPYILDLFAADTLDITLTLDTEPSVERPISLKRPLAFKSVIIRGTQSPELFPTLRQTLCQDTLRSLTVGVGAPFYIFWLGEFIQGAGRNLEHLRLHFYNMGRYHGWTGTLLFFDPSLPQ